MITSVRLQNFRSYDEKTAELSPGVTIIAGPNASGKTNLLEAVLFTCYGTSFRAKDHDLIKHNSSWARVVGRTADEERAFVVERLGERSRKSYTINTQKFTRLPNNKRLPAVLFEPQHLQLFQGGPEQRRDFIDNVLEKTKINYGKIRRDYQRTLAQRNKLLKRGLTKPSTELFAWNIRLSELGGIVARERHQLISRWNTEVQGIYQQLSNTNCVMELSYELRHPIDSYSSLMLKKLETTATVDFERGFTGDGPHKEDFTAILDGHDARSTASRGEIRTLLLCLKILELGVVERVTQKRPILLLDDVYSELDSARRKALTTYLNSYQTLITTTDADLVKQHFSKAASIIKTNRL